LNEISAFLESILGYFLGCKMQKNAHRAVLELGILKEKEECFEEDYCINMNIRRFSFSLWGI
jgi:hypothetical protein